MEDQHQSSGAAMSFQWNTHLVVLFSGWYTATGTQYAFTLLALFFFSILREGLDRGRKWADSAPELPFRRIFEGLFFAGVVIASYLLMLAVMSFNAGVFIAVVLGSICGHISFKNRGSQGHGRRTASDHADVGHGSPSKA